MRGAWRSHDLPYRSVACLALGGMSGRAAMTRVQIMYRLAVRAVLVQRTHWQKNLCTRVRNSRHRRRKRRNESG